LELVYCDTIVSQVSKQNRKGGLFMTLYTGKKVGVSKEEKTLSYYPLFQRKMTEVPAAKLALIEEPSPVPAVPFAERNRFLQGMDKEFCQVGYGVAADGTGFVCNATYMPGVTGDMLDWWFPWHSVGSDLRYKIWDPEDHYFARANNEAYVCDPSVPVSQKTWDVDHYLMEDIGFGPSFLHLQFKRPRDFGYDESLLGTAACQSLVCAIGAGDCEAAMTHKWFPYKEGVLFCSRFWIGYALHQGKIIKALPEGDSVPVEVARGLFAHNIKEFTNLAAILPEVYRENKENF
jgi:hypothetical protein